MVKLQLHLDADTYPRMLYATSSYLLQQHKLSLNLLFDTKPQDL